MFHGVHFEIVRLHKRDAAVGAQVRPLDLDTLMLVPNVGFELTVGDEAPLAATALERTLAGVYSLKGKFGIKQ
jgi:hypothetical protein